MMRSHALLLTLIACVVLSPTISAGAAQASCEAGTPAAGTAAATPAAGAGERQLEVGSEGALLWGSGDRAVLLSHGAIYDAASWRLQAESLANAGFLVLAVESTSTDDVLAAMRFLMEDCGAPGVALVGASAGASGVLGAARERPEAVTHLILVSGSGDVAGLGDYPKLFIASAGEGMADTMQRLAEEAPGDTNRALIVPGNAHAQAIFTTNAGTETLEAILDFLES